MSESETAIVFAATSLVLVAWVVATRKIRTDRLRDVSWKCGLTAFSLIYTLLAIEIVLSTVVQTNGFGGSLPNKRWAAQYWTPTINSHGYRDKEPVWSDRIVFVVGDSFPSGAGIAALEDRMGDRLAKKLGKGWTVVTIAQPGWDTARELAALKAYPRKPNVIFVSYFPNDIEGAAIRDGWQFPQLLWTPPRWLQGIIDTSEIANWAYWRLATASATGGYITWLTSAYQSPKVFATHLRDVLAIKAYADEISAELCFVLWPILIDIDASAAILEQVGKALKANNIAAIDLLPLLRARSLDERIVSREDPHPSILAHADAAEEMYKWLVVQRR